MSQIIWYFKKLNDIVIVRGPFDFPVFFSFFFFQLFFLLTIHFNFSFTLKPFSPLSIEVPHSARTSDNTETLTLLFQMWFTLSDVADGINKCQEDHFHTLYDPSCEGCVNHNKNTSPAFSSGEVCGKCRLKSRNQTQWSIHIKTEMKVFKEEIKSG